MVGIRLMIIMAIVGGIIAYLADKMGSRIGKKKMSVFGLRPKHTALLLTVLSGIIISTVSILTVTISSESARTALFGMEKIQAEIKALNKEKELANAALKEVKDNVVAQNEIIELLDKDIKKTTDAKNAIEAQLQGMQGKYALAKMEVKSLSDAKENLAKEIKNLEATTEQLREGIINMREGQVFYRAGEVVHTAVLRGGMSGEENKEQILWLLQAANDSALQHLGELKPEKPIQLIWVANDVVDDTVNTLNKSKENYVCRLRTIANIIVGELVVCEIEMVPDKLIYDDGDEICNTVFNTLNKQIPADAVIMDFLTEINHTAVAQGVLPDPVTGKVGNVDAETIIVAASDIKRISGPVKITAYAKGKVTTAGPVRISLKVKPVNTK